MLERIFTDASLLIPALALLGAFILFVWKLFSNWFKVHYVPRTELLRMLENIEKAFAEDLAKSSEAGVELSKFIASQLEILQQAILSKESKDE